MTLVSRNRNPLLQQSAADDGPKDVVLVDGILENSVAHSGGTQAVYSSGYPLSTQPSLAGTTILVPGHQGDYGRGTPPPAPLPQRHGLAASLVIAYIVVLFLVTVVVGGWLYSWANSRVVQSWPLNTINEPAAEIPMPAASQEAGIVVDAASSNITASTVDTPSAISIPRLNILLLGTDARPDDTEPARTDTMILLALDPQQKSAGMLSLPRDIWLPIPGLGYSDKINMAYVHGQTEGYEGGGAQLAKDTVSSFIGQPVDYYVRVNFHGFVELVDLIGGIDVVVPNTIHDEQYPDNNYGFELFHLEAGTQHLDGDSALKYVRTRHSDDDYGRARRQQQVIRAVLDKVMRADMIPTLMPKAFQLLGIMRSSIDTDIAMSTQIELANYLRTVSLDDITFRQEVLDSRYGEETFSEYGHWILKPDREKVRNAMRRFFETDVAADSGEALALTDPSWVRVEVLNGTGQPGVAARTRDLLQAQGWQVVSIGDADRGNYDRTIVVNYGHVPQPVVAQMSTDLHLSSTLPSLELSRLASNNIAPVDVRIVLGSDILPNIR